MSKVLSPGKINFNSVSDIKYKNLLLSEYRVIKNREREIRIDSRIVYYYRLNDKNKDKKLYALCCDFKLLEEVSANYKNNS